MGQKMSKSYNNFINIFLPEKQLRKQVMKIVTDDKSLEEPKDPDNSIIVELFALIGSKERTESLKQKFRQGDYGYGHAKQELFEMIMDAFAKQRSEFDRYMAEKGLMDEVLHKGAEKAAVVANETLKRVRDKLGYNYG